MKNKLSMFVIFIHTAFLLWAQDASKGEHWNTLRKISNKKADFFVSNPVRFKDSTGNVVSVKNVIVLEDEYLNKIAKKYGKKILPELILLLSDSTRDWAANLLLYSITNTDAVVLKYYSITKIEEWRTYRKQDDVNRWKDYFIKPNNNKVSP